MDNIKHWLSLGQVDAEVDGRFNPTDIPVTYADVILAYLTFLTWTIDKALENLEQPPGGYPRNINRRFAMPCLTGADFKEVHHRLRRYLGEAQILADTFFSDMREGLPLQRFVEAVALLREGGRRDYKFVREGLTEPLGVAGSLMNYNSEKEHDMVAMVIDVGAGTTDFSVYRMHVDPEEEIRVAVEATGSVHGITEAGNHLDLALMGLILQSCGIDPEQGIPERVQWYLQRNIRDFKEELFDQGEIHVSLPGGTESHITRKQFLETPGVKDFTNALDQKMVDILESINKDWVDLIGSSIKIQYLTVVLTGGGASLPMVQELANREILVHGRPIRVVAAKGFPSWLEEAHSELELDYPRIAVSFGGARKKLIERSGTASAIAGGVTGPLVYDDPKYRW
jgi:molecular chaperone HscA